MRGIDLVAIRERLSGKTGRQYWRSLEELADSPDFREMLHREFPPGACEPDSSLSRRNFLRLMGASLALAGASGGCWRQPEEKIVPYVEQPEILVPGRPLHYATAFNFRGYGIGAIAESHMGRPTKIEGNPEHPASLGAANPFMQASILGLYDPDRSQVVTRGGDVSTWEAFVSQVRRELPRFEQSGGAGLRILSCTMTSPTLLWQMQQLLQRFPQARWHRFDPIGRENIAEGARLAFGQAAEPVYDFERADVIVSLESNFLFDEPSSLVYARQFVRRRRIARPNDPNARPGAVRLNRLYVAEASPSITGAMADYRLPIRSGQVQQLAVALAQRLGGGVGGANVALGQNESRWLDDVVQHLQQHGGRSLIVAGDSQPPLVHALAHVMNQALGNVGTTVRYIAPPVAAPRPDETLEALARDMDAGAVDTLLILDANPVYTAPADLNFAQRMQQVRQRIHLGSHSDETAFLCHWHIPMSHDLESWGDIRAHDGLATIIQPLIHPLYPGTRTAHQVLAALLGQDSASSHNIVRSFWQTRLPQENFETVWRESLHQGFVAGTASPPANVSPQMQRIAQALRAPATAPATHPATQPGTTQPVELVFRPDPSVWDGSYGNNGWLQELPKPLTKLTWDNAALISPAMAQRMNLSNEDVIRLSAGGQQLDVPVYIVPGHADGAVTLTLGYGRTRSGRVGNGTGFDAYRLRHSTSRWARPDVSVARTGRRYVLATTQQHFNMEGRHLIQLMSPSQLGKVLGDPHGHVGLMDQPRGSVQVEEQAHEPRRLPLSMYPDSMPSDPPYPKGSYQWGMSIDLSSCIGCNACVVACQAENNIPIVGKEGVRNGREMHWLRIDTYYSAPEATPIVALDNPDVYFQPLPCMHCEKAPCEVVCPVAATTHSDEGINEMTYNRCIGTRYCSNNCPYKVRRFNFFEYNPPNQPAVQRMRQNPDVTVRTRGVMEKCTYCIQRINQGRIDAEKQNRRIRDGEFTTACAQSCPTQAIVFGDINNEQSLVHAMKFTRPFEVHDYSLLNVELGTRPRTTYLPRIVPEEKAHLDQPRPAPH